MQAPSKIPFDGFPLIEYFPKPFTSLARNKKGLIAASRIDGSIDIYDANEGFFVIHHIPSWILTSIEAVCWIDDRLFATGGEGRVYELQLYSPRPKASVLLPGGVPARCLVPGEGILVSGNDGGYINVIDVSDDQLDLKSCLASLDDKIVALALDDKNRKIVAASDAKGRVYIFSLENGSTLSTYFVGDEYAIAPTIVWSLLFVGNSLFSGDSKGNVSVWDVDIGVMASTFKTHTVDVLALAASSDQSTVFATGVDPTIRRFDLCITERNCKFASQKSWKFDPASGEPVVTLSRLGWTSNTQERRVRSISSSASSDNEVAAVDEAVDEMSTSRFFLDQSSADLFVTSSKGEKSLQSLSGLDKDFDSHLAVAAPQTRKRKMSTGLSEDQSDEASALPPASLMAFTPSSRCLVTVDSVSQSVNCRRLDTGVECWNLSRHSAVSTTTTDSTPVAPIHILKMAKFPGEHSSFILLAIASLDARVSIYLFKEGENSPPALLFTCPRAADPMRVGYHSRPVDIALLTGKFKARESENGDASSELKSFARCAVFYTSGQLVEWTLPISLVEGGVQLKGTPKTDLWLEEFWQQNSASWRRLMPRFGYLNYYYGGKIFLLGSKNLCLTIDRRKKVAPNDVQWALRLRNSKISDHCLHIFDNVKVNTLSCLSMNAVEHAVLPDRIAAITLNTVAAKAELPIPLKKKYFGT
ncbi:unnamed protein product [Rodentolepis nana]|uniref:WD_REPEATS_REGION domain-containing protein n=1 Tax=Rodentolepis nana TaxID=102285 RepID=A0A158QIP5_RODNA|nr:unnamed protein product [Rodentolepis nana]